jgi:hypothetical protein
MSRGERGSMDGGDGSLRELSGERTVPECADTRSRHRRLRGGWASVTPVNRDERRSVYEEHMKSRGQFHGSPLLTRRVLSDCDRSCSHTETGRFLIDIWCWIKVYSNW